MRKQGCWQESGAAEKQELGDRSGPPAPSIEIAAFAAFREAGESLSDILNFLNATIGREKCQMIKDSIILNY